MGFHLNTIISKESTCMDIIEGLIISMEGTDMAF